MLDLLLGKVGFITGGLHWMSLVEVDTHVHTLASVHAYNSLYECAFSAKKNKLKGIVITDHFGPFFLSNNIFQHYSSISNICRIEEKIYDQMIFPGVEIDIIDAYGHLAFYNSFFPFDKNKSILDKLLSKKLFVVASLHDFNYISDTETDVTQLLINVLLNDKVNVLGHCERINKKFDLDEILKVAYSYNKVIELNMHSFLCCEDGYKKVRELAIKCAEYNTLVSVGSDAHFAYEIGRFDKMSNMLQEIGFPKKNIINHSLSFFEDYLKMNIY